MLLFLASLSLIAADDLDGQPIPETPVYTITSCEAPVAPQGGRIRTVDQYNESVDLHAAYVNQVMDYLGCVESAAQTDFDRIAAAIRTTTQAELEKAQNDVNAAKERLDEQRARFLTDSGVE